MWWAVTEVSLHLYCCVVGCYRRVAQVSRHGLGAAPALPAEGGDPGPAAEGCG